MQKLSSATGRLSKSWQCHTHLTVLAKLRQAVTVPAPKESQCDEKLFQMLHSLYYCAFKEPIITVAA